MGLLKKVGKVAKKALPVAAGLGAGYLLGPRIAQAFGNTVGAESQSGSSSVWDAVGSIGSFLKGSLPTIASAAQIGAPFWSGEAQDKTNELNRDMAREQMAFQEKMVGRQEQFQSGQVSAQQAYNTQQAQAQMAFQERMSNTARQREMADLRSAGLNPMMAAMNGATAPQGASAASSAASGSSAGGSLGHPAQSSGSARLQSAMAIATLNAQLEKMSAETDKVRAETKTELERPESVRQSTSLARESTNRLVFELKHLLPAEVDLKLSQAAHTDVLKQLDLSRIRTEIHRAGSELKHQNLLAAEAIIRELEIRKSLNESEFQRGAWAQNVSPYLGDLGRVSNSAANMRWYLGPRR